MPAELQRGVRDDRLRGGTILRSIQCLLNCSVESVMTASGGHHSAVNSMPAGKQLSGKGNRVIQVMVVIVPFAPGGSPDTLSFYSPVAHRAICV